ncbi:homing endonuclease associated repeat-containing protein [Solidesulfovibrio sp. C21]|uniref:homing endonuclease associated repeat-containing protein n=1 Tax=Solidesulfovibrio sp. C21 TaxID=3398613 RepID=UPI0039FBF9E3
MPKKKYSKESILKLLQNISTNQGITSLTKKDICNHIPASTVNYYFGSLSKACDAAGIGCAEKGANLASIAKSNAIDDGALFQSLFELECDLGHTPSYNEYSSSGKFSTRPFRKRFSTWGNALVYYEKWRIENEIVNNTKNTTDGKNQIALSDSLPSRSMCQERRAKGNTNDVFKFYGEPINFRGLRHAPINEQGFVYLFGMVSKELGFFIESIQQGFPDCEGKYLFDQKKNLWARARIEFEYLSSNFKEHGHDVNECDFIVCWVNDWKDCPISIIELSKEIIKLNSK